MKYLVVIIALTLSACQAKGPSLKEINICASPMGIAQFEGLSFNSDGSAVATAADATILVTGSSNCFKIVQK